MTSRFFTELASTEAPRYLRSSHPMYERKPVTDLWKALTSVAEMQLRWKAVPDADKRDAKWLDRKSRLMQVSGPPGSGKSSAVYAWAHKTCLSSGYHVVWVDVVANKTQDVGCWSLRRDTNHQAVRMETIAASQFDADIVIFDGLRKETLEEWESTLKKLSREGVAVILVSSQGVRLHAGNMKDISALGYRFPSWSCRHGTWLENKGSGRVGRIRDEDSNSNEGRQQTLSASRKNVNISSKSLIAGRVPLTVNVTVL